MSNPMFTNRTSPNGATAPDNGLNESHKRYFQGYNRFDLGRQFFNTERYADINVVDVVDGVEGDNIKFGVKHDIRSYTWKSPKMFDIHKKITYFMVDRSAILPNNWEKVYKQPNKGDDVTVDVNSVSSHLFDYLITYINDFKDSTVPESVDYMDGEYLLKFVLLLESIFSNGSLPASMNAHLSSMIRAYKDDDLTETISFDTWLESLYQRIIPLIFIRSNKFEVTFNTSINDEQAGLVSVSKAWLLDYMRSNDDWYIEGYDERGTSSRTDFYNDIRGFLLRLYDVRRRESSVDYSSEDYSFNFSRLVAYQLCIAQFYTRDSVDDIYTSELWMQNQNSLYRNVLASYGVTYPTFTYNGVTTFYDTCSGKVFDDALSRFLSVLTLSDTSEFGIYIFNSLFGYFRNIFFFGKSLRYGDYFNGAKTLPYAPVDVVAQVVGNGVSAIETTRSIIAQRFANSVERVSNTMKDYVSKLMGGTVPPNPLEPRFLASITSKVGGFEVENTTSENQGNIVTLLRSGSSNYVYSVDVGTPCIIIGVSTYSVPLVYSETTERFWHHKDRFDMFNKFFQNIGDQEITQFERSSAFSPRLNFAYTPRNMEYKQRYNIASGAFVESLPGYAFISDNSDSGNNVSAYTSAMTISPDYLRNNNFELDRFYASLTGLSLANYFHFILRYDLFVDSRRQMEYSPTIL